MGQIVRNCLYFLKMWLHLGKLYTGFAFWSLYENLFILPLHHVRRESMPAFSYTNKRNEIYFIHPVWIRTNIFQTAQRNIIKGQTVVYEVQCLSGRPAQDKGIHFCYEVTSYEQAQVFLLSDLEDSKLVFTGNIVFGVNQPGDENDDEDSTDKGAMT